MFYSAASNPCLLLLHVVQKWRYNNHIAFRIILHFSFASWIPKPNFQLPVQEPWSDPVFIHVVWIIHPYSGLYFSIRTCCFYVTVFAAFLVFFFRINSLLFFLSDFMWCKFLGWFFFKMQYKEENGCLLFLANVHCVMVWVVFSDQCLTYILLFRMFIFS